MAAIAPAWRVAVEPDRTPLALVCLRGYSATRQQAFPLVERVGDALGERVVLLSTSTGGTRSTWAASRSHDGSLAALVMISPSFAPRNWCGS